MNRRSTLGLTIISLAFVAALAFARPGTAAEQPGKIKVLLVTGDDVQPAHNWREVSQALRETLITSDKFDVRLCEDAGVLDSTATVSHYVRSETTCSRPTTGARFPRRSEKHLSLVTSLMCGSARTPACSIPPRPSATMSDLRRRAAGPQLARGFPGAQRNTYH